MTKSAVVVMLCGAMVIGVSDASAQMLQWTDRGFLNVSGGMQTAKRDVPTTLAFPLYDETATIQVTRALESGPFWDATAGVRVWSNLALGVSVAGRTSPADGTAVASIPHPIFYAQPRTVSATLAGMQHKELWTGLVAIWTMPITNAFEVMVMAGPSIAKVDHEVPLSSTVAEAGATPSVTIGLSTVKKSVWGFTVGADARYLITKRFGLGAFARYNSATINLSSTTKLDVSGFQVGAGLRVRF